MRLFVDYTNWKGRRAWREIESLDKNGPICLNTVIGFVPVDASKYEKTFIIHVAMVDKGGARRTLRLDHIHGFSTDPAVLTESSHV